MARNYAALFHEYGEEMQELSDAEFGRLCRALIQYSADGTPIALCGNERFYAKRVMLQEDRAKASYQEVARARSEAGKAGAEKRWGQKTDDSNAWQTIANDNKNAKSISKSISTSPNGDGSNKRTRFTPPTLEEVEDYVYERNSPVDPRKFWEYFEAGGWKDAKGNPVRNWKQKLLTWEKYDDKPKTGSKKTFADMWREEL